VFDVSCPPCQHLPVKRLAKRLASDLKRTFWRKRWGLENAGRSMVLVDAMWKLQSIVMSKSHRWQLVVFHMNSCNSSPWYRWPIEIEDFPIKTSIYQGFSMAMLNNQMVKRGLWPPKMRLPTFARTASPPRLVTFPASPYHIGTKHQGLGPGKSRSKKGGWQGGDQ
jgi:hypothetical protein